MVGWQTVRFNRLKQPDPLHKYLEPPLKPEQRREQGAKKVAAMFASKMKKGKVAEGS